MRDYEKLIKRWVFTKVSVSIISLIGILMIGVIGIAKEMYLLTITMIVIIGVAWLIMNELINFLKPFPPMKIIPMQIPPKENNDESSKN